MGAELKLKLVDGSEIQIVNFFTLESYGDYGIFTNNTQNEYGLVNLYVSKLIEEESVSLEIPVGEEWTVLSNAITKMFSQDTNEIKTYNYIIKDASQIVLDKDINEVSQVVAVTERKVPLLEKAYSEFLNTQTEEKPVGESRDIVEEQEVEELVFEEEPVEITEPEPIVEPAAPEVQVEEKPDELEIFPDSSLTNEFKVDPKVPNPWDIIEPNQKITEEDVREEVKAEKVLAPSIENDAEFLELENAEDSFDLATKAIEDAIQLAKDALAQGKKQVGVQRNNLRASMEAKLEKYRIEVRLEEKRKQEAERQAIEMERQAVAADKAKIIALHTAIKNANEAIAIHKDIVDSSLNQQAKPEVINNNQALNLTQEQAA